MLDVYNGTLGFTFNKAPVVKLLEEYIVKHREDDLSYEFKKSPNYKIVALLGRFEDEKHIPYFRHPMIINSIDNNTYIIGDFRIFLKKNIRDYNDIYPNLADVYNGKFLLFRMALIARDIDVTKDSNSEDSFKNYNYTLSEFLGSVIGSNITRMKNDLTLFDSCLLASTTHVATMEHTTMSFAIDSYIPSNILRKIINGNNELYKRLLGAKDNNITLPSRTLQTLVDLIKYLADKPSLSGLNGDLIIMMLSNGFYSLNKNENTVAMLESKTTLITVLYLVATESINKRGLFFRIMKTNRSIKYKEFVESISIILNEYLIPNDLNKKF